MTARKAMLLTAGVGAAALVAVACGPGSGAGPVDGATAGAAGDEISNSATNDASGYAPEESGQGVATAPCVTVTPSPVVVNTYGIPTQNETFTFTACTATDAAFTATLNGTASVSPSSSVPINVNHYDFTRSDNFDLTVDTNASPPAPILSATDVGNVIASYGSSGSFGTYLRDVSKSKTVTFVGKDLKSHTAATSRAWTLTYTPGSSWHRDLRPVAGTVSISGSYTGTIDGRQIDGTVSTPTALSIDPACRTWVVAGELDRVGANLTIKIVWSGCGSYTVTHTP